MLIKLTSNTSGEMIMLAEHAHRLFHIIGKECTARGVFTFEQLPAALARLYQAVDEEKLAAKRRAEQAQVEDEPPEKDEAGAEQQVDAQIGLGQRAQPLIRLMEWTAKEEGFILWQADQDF